jgi:hypothetical protein
MLLLPSTKFNQGRDKAVSEVCVSRYPLNAQDALKELARLRVNSSGPELGDLAKALLGQPAVPPPLVPPPVRRAWFKHQIVQVDGYTFEDCRFDACQLVTEVATFSFHRCFISPDCRLYFRGAALKTVRLLMHLLQLQGRIQVGSDEAGVYATVNQDGTFSLE